MNLGKADQTITIKRSYVWINDLTVHVNAKEKKYLLNN